MANERKIGRIVSVDSLNVYVRLDDDLKSLYKSGYEEIYPVARINSYIIIPVGADRIVAMINRVQTREESEIGKNAPTIYLPESVRYLTATMLGTIEGGCKEYKQGVYNYPILDNPVWYTTREDLNKIFDQVDNKTRIDFKEDYYLPIGTSPVFPDYKVKINPDKMFGKHLAILGNTGSGKSCTLTSLLHSLFDFDYQNQKLKSSHIIIFDTNGEYPNAFNLNQSKIINPFCITAEGLKVPYWFMNFDDMDYLFEPTSGSQAPILKRALAMAKSEKKVIECKGIPLHDLNSLRTLITNIEYADFREYSSIYNSSEKVLAPFSNLLSGAKVDFDLQAICDNLKIISDQKSNIVVSKSYYNPSNNFDIGAITAAVEEIKRQLESYYIKFNIVDSSQNRSLDMPVFYDFKELITTYFDCAISESSVSNDKLSEYIATLRLRMQSFMDDTRLASPLLLNNSHDIADGLSKFIAYIMGDYAKVYNVAERGIYDEYFKTKLGDNLKPNQITIIDMSLLPYQVLETITGLIGRIILEFLSRFAPDQRGKDPTVLVLEEAQNYIPENNKKEKESISKKVFERIAREGRKYGLSLVVSSQRPSELSKTVLSQCNSFIVHRIQNPEDQQYIRKLVSSASSDVLSQLPILPQQHAIVMGDAVRTPIVVRINDASPRPNSNNPEFIENWLQEKSNTPDYKNIAKKWCDNSDDTFDQEAEKINAQDNISN